MMNRKFWSASILILVTLALCSESQGLVDDQSERETIKGIQGVYVMVDVSKELGEIGINREIIQTDTELKLRLAGIRVFTMSECKVTPGNPALYVYILGLKIPDLPMKFPTYHFYIEVSVLQNVVLERNFVTATWKPTWGLNYIGVCGMANLDNTQKHIRDVTKDFVDKFINAYLSVNPKGGK